MNTRIAAVLFAAGLAFPALAQDAPANAKPLPVPPNPAACISAEEDAQLRTIAAAVPAPQAEVPRIDVVFVLDTTGSMAGLIEGAKQKIWSIANQTATAKPRPQIRMGLVGYRDRCDEYVTKLTPLTDDLDAVYSDLMKYSASGGGDGPESVNQALHEAVTKFDWSKDAKALRIIYLVGDAPPHMDYSDDTKYPDTCAAAAKAGLIINTIQCGTDSTTTPIWTEIARKSEGEFFAIEQSGGAVAVATPFDADLARLGTELDGTVIAYGTREELTAQTAKIEMSARVAAGPAPAEAKAERAAFKASAAGASCLTGQKDLVQDCAIDRKVDLKNLPVDQLSPELQKIPAAERAAFLQQKAEARARFQAQITEINQQRLLFIKDHLAKQGQKKDSFDFRILESLKKQGARCGLSYDDPC